MRHALPPSAIDRLLPFRVTCDAELTILEVGPSLRRFTGDVVGRGFLDVFEVQRPAHAVETGAAKASLEVLWTVRAPRSLLLRGPWLATQLVDADARLFAGTPWITDPAQLESLGLTLRDLPDHDQVMEHMFHLQAQRAQLRDLQEISDRLTAARNAAEQANRAKTRFLANVSHELRTPLHVVLGFADILSRPDLSPAARAENAAALQRNGEAITRLIDDLLDLSRIEEGALQMVERPARLDRLLQDVVSALRPKALAKGLTLELLGQDAVAHPVLLDEVRVRQIVGNLVDNAIKFTEAGRVTVRGKALTSLGDGVRMAVIVDDTGMGVGEDAHQLFEPFTRLERGRSSGVEGSGLGLALSRRLARAMHGDLRHEPIPDGSRFILELTTKRGPAPDAPAVVLLVGSNRDTLALARRLLERGGHRVVEAPDVAAAVRDILAAPPERRVQVAIVEPNLPDGEASDIVRRLLQASSITPVLGFPGSPTDRLRMLAGGCRGVLEAPIRQEALLHQVRAVTSNG